jgi:hypothetical protein
MSVFADQPTSRLRHGVENGLRLQCNVVSAKTVPTEDVFLGGPYSVKVRLQPRRKGRRELKCKL